MMKVNRRLKKLGWNSTFKKQRLQHLVHYFMANRWGKNANSWQTLVSLAAKSLQMVTAAMKPQDHFPWKKICDQYRQHIKKQSHYLPRKVCIVKAMFFFFFPLVMCGCEVCTIKKAKHWKIDASELWCWRRLLRVPWTARRSNLPILK